MDRASTDEAPDDHSHRENACAVYGWHPGAAYPGITREGCGRTRGVDAVAPWAVAMNTAPVRQTQLGPCDGMPQGPGW